ncbi:MAG: hypothetical protein IJO74_01975 [Clostridia bacterium]|nr:hypothetical protein [Clostridia bacterium]
MKKILFILFAFCLILLTSCSDGSMGGHPVGKMELSNKAVDFTFYYPDTWLTNMNEGMVCLYVANDDPSNVSVTTFGLGEDFSTLDEYISGLPESFTSQWNAVFGQTDFGTPEEITLGGVPAKKLTYEVTIGQIPYRYIQVFALKDSNVYTLTYAARTEVFDKHLKNVNGIIESFSFK